MAFYIIFILLYFLHFTIILLISIAVTLNREDRLPIYKYILVKITVNVIYLRHLCSIGPEMQLVKFINTAICS